MPRQAAQHGRVPLTTAMTIIALTGFMGCGKTSTGQALANRLGWEFFDLDEEIEKQEHTPIRELFRTLGETRFREIEREALQRCLARCSKPTIIALGGGVFVQQGNAAMLSASGVRTVFLEAPLEQMLQRCGVTDNPDLENPRPLAADSAAFRKLYELRLPSYRTAQLTVLTVGKSVDEIAHEIADGLQLTSTQ